jgi:hemerythrin
MKIFDATSIDQQHQELVNKFSRLNRAVKNYEKRENIYLLIHDVIVYTRLHFEFEERIMIQTEYLNIEWHRNQHEQLIQDALRLRKKLDYVGEEMFTDWFNHWPFAKVLAHIQYADRQIFEEIY